MVRDVRVAGMKYVVGLGLPFTPDVSVGLIAEKPYNILLTRVYFLQIFFQYNVEIWECVMVWVVLEGRVGNQLKT